MIQHIKENWPKNNTNKWPSSDCFTLIGNEELQHELKELINLIGNNKFYANWKEASDGYIPNKCIALIESKLDICPEDTLGTDFVFWTKCFKVDLLKFLNYLFKHNPKQRLCLPGRTSVPESGNTKLRRSSRVNYNKDGCCWSWDTNTIKTYSEQQYTKSNKSKNKSTVNININNLPPKTPIQTFISLTDEEKTNKPMQWRVDIYDKIINNDDKIKCNKQEKDIIHKLKQENENFAFLPPIIRKLIKQNMCYLLEVVEIKKMKQIIEAKPSKYWLTDNMIDLCFAIPLQPFNDDILVISCILTHTLTFGRAAGQDKSITKYYTKFKFELEKAKMIVFPVINDRINGNHWLLHVFQINKQQDTVNVHWMYFDSMNGKHIKEDTDKIKKSMNKILRKLYSDLVFEKMKVIKVEPGQKNSYDCGLYPVTIISKLQNNMLENDEVIMIELQEINENRTKLTQQIQQLFNYMTDKTEKQAEDKNTDAQSQAEDKEQGGSEPEDETEDKEQGGSEPEEDTNIKLGSSSPAHKL